jgi:hypothetical protein
MLRVSILGAISTSLELRIKLLGRLVVKMKSAEIERVPSRGSHVADSCSTNAAAKANTVNGNIFTK